MSGHRMFKVWNEEHDFAGYITAPTAEAARKRFAFLYGMSAGSTQRVA